MRLDVAALKTMPRPRSASIIGCVEVLDFFCVEFAPAVRTDLAVDELAGRWRLEILQFSQLLVILREVSYPAAACDTFAAASARVGKKAAARMTAPPAVNAAVPSLNKERRDSVSDGFPGMSVTWVSIDRKVIHSSY